MMDRINNFIDCLLSQRGITKDDREELRLELLDHLTLLRQEYIDNGYNEDEAINLALKNFGDTNEIGNGIKRTLPSRNKYKDFSKIEIFKTIIFMLLGYFTTIFYLFPNRWYLLYSLIENIIGSEITHVSKNVLFLIINHRIFIPNIGLAIFIAMGVVLYKQINKKGIESLI